MDPSMLTLDLQNYPSCDSRGYPTSSERHYTLNWVDLGDSDAGDLSLLSGQDALHFTARSLIYMHYSRVFLGRLTSGNLEHRPEVILKFIETNVSRIRTEAELYATVLKNVRGSLVPTFYGYFAGKSSHGDVACILLQYGGVTLSPDTWMCVPIEMRKNIMDNLIHLHSLGIFHGRFFPTNVVVDETGHCRIIDFDDAQPHECEVENRQYQLFQLEPTWAEMPCEELQDISEGMAIWTPRRARFYGVTVDIRSLPSVEDLVKQVREHRPFSQMTVEEWTRKARQFLIECDRASKERKRILEEIETRKASTDARTDDALAATERLSATKQLGRLSDHGTSTTRSLHSNQQSP